MKEIPHMSVIDLRRQFKERADEAEAIRRQGARNVEIDKALMRLVDRLDRKGLSVAEIADRLRCWADDIAELALEDPLSA